MQVIEQSLSSICIKPYILPWLLRNIIWKHENIKISEIEMHLVINVKRKLAAANRTCSRVVSACTCGNVILIRSDQLISRSPQLSYLNWQPLMWLNLDPYFPLRIVFKDSTWCSNKVKSYLYTEDKLSHTKLCNGRQEKLPDSLKSKPWNFERWDK